MEKIPPHEFTSDAEKFARIIVQENGPKLAESNPEIAEDAREGLSPGEISTKYAIAEHFNVSEKIAYSIVATALRCLLTIEEREKIYTPRVRAIRSKLGQTLKENEKGIFGRSLEQRKADSKKANEVNKSMGVGIHAFTKEQLSEAGKKGGASPREGGWKGGKIVDGMDEGAYVLFLLEKEEFLHPKGTSNAGQPDYVKIMEAVNRKFENSRSLKAVSSFVDYQRAIEKRKKNKLLT